MKAKHCKNKKNKVRCWVPPKNTRKPFVTQTLILTFGSGTFNIPEGATSVDYVIIGGGGGGGAGGTGVAAEAPGGGGGGGRANMLTGSLVLTTATINNSGLVTGFASPVSYTVGPGGSGGIPGPIGPTGGPDGNTGGDTTLTIATTNLVASGGFGGLAGVIVSGGNGGDWSGGGGSSVWTNPVYGLGGAPGDGAPGLDATFVGGGNGGNGVNYLDDPYFSEAVGVGGSGGINYPGEYAGGGGGGGGLGAIASYVKAQDGFGGQLSFGIGGSGFGSGGGGGGGKSRGGNGYSGIIFLRFT